LIAFDFDMELSRERYYDVALDQTRGLDCTIRGFYEPRGVTY